jgi:membrane-bound lytic murein transglycosylase MltF
MEPTILVGCRSMELSVDTSGRRLVACTSMLLLIAALLCVPTVRGLGGELLKTARSLFDSGRAAPVAAPVARRGLSRSFAGDIQRLLPQYRDHFHAAATRSGVDWRLLAAIGYQESHWNPQAVSYTGVRGLMMLTQDTAAILDVSDREDAEQSIHGGARWFAQLRRRLPRQIAEPDRTAMALAAYNQGLGHLLDARQLAVLRGGDANRWADVRDALPLLAQVEWAARTRYGRARGDEAVEFVDRVLRYHEALRAIDGAAAAKPQVVASR